MQPIEPLQPSDPGPPFPSRSLPPARSHHPVSRAALRRFAQGAADREEAAAIVRHLLARCGGCAGFLAGLWQGRVGSSGEYDQAIDRSTERALAALAVHAR